MVVLGAERRVDAESAAVEVDDERETSPVAGGYSGKIQPCGDAGLGRDHDVFTFDSGFGVERRRNDVGTEESLNTTVFIDF